MEWRGILLIVAGLVTLLWPERIAKRVREQYDRRLAELRSGAEEAYFEEQRSMLAYPPSPLWRWTREVGFVLVAAGLASLLFF